MNLRSKLLFIIFGFLVLQLGAFYTYYKVILLPQFETYEQLLAKQSINRGFNAIQKTLTHIQTLSQIWALNTDNLNNPNPALQKQWIKDNFNLFLILDLNQKIQYQFTYDNQTKQHFLLPDAINQLLKTPTPFNVTPQSGIILTEQGPFITMITPVFNNEGALSKHLIIGQLLTQSLLDNLNFSSQTKLQLWPIATTILPENLQIILNSIQASSEKIYFSTSDSAIIAYKMLPDIQGLPKMVLASTSPKNSTLFIQQDAKEIYAVLLAVNFILILLLLKIMNDNIINPTRKLTLQLYNIDDNIEAPLRIKNNSKDEIGILSRAINKVIIHFCENRTTSIRKAYQAGIQSMRAEMLQDVIHTAEPVVMLADRIEKSLHQLPLNVLERITAEFVTRPPEAERQTLLTKQLQAINLALRENLKEIRQEIRDLRIKVLRISTTIHSHALNLDSPKSYTVVKSKSESITEK